MNQTAVQHRVSGATEDECSANAHLIASAPDLYAAVEAALYLFDGEDPGAAADTREEAEAARARRFTQIGQCLRSALALARGEVTR